MKEVIMKVPSFSADYPKAPIYVADVVRCKACVHNPLEVCGYNHCWHFEKDVDPEDFCSHAERRVSDEISCR